MPAPSEPSLAAKIEAASARMHVRYQAAQRLEQAVAFSDVSRARREAHDMAELVEPDALPRWRPYLERVSAAARVVEQAPDVVRAARASSALGRECARCHAAIAAKITFVAQPRPATTSRLAVQMTDHQWAAARLWEGLIGPSDERWLEGARTLMQAPLTTVAASSAPSALGDAALPDASGLEDDVARVRLYANRAAGMSDPDARAELYGQLLATCAHCHAVIRDR